MKKYYLALVLTLFVLSIFAQNVPSFVPKDGLVGWWPFNGNANDESGNGNHGTVNGASLTEGNDGKTNSAFNFLQNQYIEIKSLNQNNINGYTISAWFKKSMNNANTDGAILSGSYPGQSPGGLRLNMGTINRFQWQVEDYPGQNGILQMAPGDEKNYCDDKWHSVVSTFSSPNGLISSSAFKIYVDGSLVQTISNHTNWPTWDTTTYAPINNGNRNIIIGNSGGNYFNYSNSFLGSLEDIGIWNRALSEKEIIDLYAGNKDCSYLTTTIIPDGNTTFCVGNYVNLKTEAKSNYTYQWYKNDISLNGSKTAEYKATETGNYHVEVSDEQCKVISNNITVTVNPIKECLSNSITYIPGGIVKDYDDNDYETVIIGKQLWMKTNLRTTHFSNGDSIRTIADGTQWYLTTNNSLAAWSPVGGDPSHDKLRGKLYNWYAVNDSRNICPIGFKVPTNDDWDSLVKYLDPNSDLKIVGVQSRIAGAYLKDTLNNLWNWGNIGAANVTGFSARPAGIRGYYGNYYGGGDGIFMWSNTENGQYHAFFRGIDAYSTSISKATTQGIDNKSTGGSVRCMRNLLSDCANVKAYIYVTGQSDICSGDSVKLSTNGFGKGTTNQWFLDGKPIQGATFSNYTAKSAGSYSVSVKYDLCSDTSVSKVITVHPNPKVSIVALGNTTFCSGGFVNLNAEGGSSYLWNTGSKSAQISVKQAGTYIVNVTNSYGCEASATQVVNVYPTPDVTFSNLSPFILHDSPVIELIASPLGGKFEGEGVYGTNFNPSKTTLGKKEIKYIYTSPEGCSNLVSRSTIVVDSSGNICKVTKYDTITVTNNVTKYDTVKINKTIFDTVTVTKNVTKYDTVKVTKYDTITVKNNVYDTVTITNNVTKYDTITLTDTVSILKIKFKLTTGIQANQMASMSVYPNPTTDVLHIEVGDAKALDGYRYRILDALGKEVYNELVNNTITEIPLKTLGAAGMYQLEVLDQKNVRIQANKIVLQ